MGSYCACALSWPLPELSIRGAGQKDRSSGDKNVLRRTGLKLAEGTTDIKDIIKLVNSGARGNF